MPAALRSLIKAMRERLSGSKPGVLRALAAAFAAAVMTYRFLRSES
jgi:hypothetical protein